MKKLLLPLFLLAAAIVVGACGNQADKGAPEPAGTGSNSGQETSGTGTFMYESEAGPVEVPLNPQRVVVLTRFLTGNVLALGVPVVGVDEMSKENPRFQEQLKDVEVISDESVEKIMELEPDLIIGMDGTNNLDKFKQIAPTVIYTYDKVDYLEQQVEVGKLLNKEKEAREWVEDFKKRAQQAGEEIRAKIGDDATVSVIETFSKQLYVYGDNFGRGTEILYQLFQLKMPEKVKAATVKDGFFAVSTEVLGDYFGDYVIFSKNSEEDNTFQETQTYNNILAVQQNRVFEANAKSFYFRDPLSLEHQLEFFTESFLGK
ncbi:iron-hydroxamate ABC transporter substrate-binding protein [Paenibacillus pinisoli]|uniref:Iron-hydroxamate ABC transporter substrate-binding protein n=1 Tax=Paenibacillus pinisoli TaxID=1276110 RepID=A0A3A6Q2V7_9BACL|nr:iron-hydroxamate ABC transporter substrate-binding protein [Paenibacillus pinisoli]RJX41733.1 iron-hydroxamate ABC transporter substrate-binding protein [Paenibacillus pinisoli]